MLKNNLGELPTSKKNLSDNDVLRHQLFNHYINHRYRDIPEKNFVSRKKVIDGIIEKFSKKYRPEKYFRNRDGSDINISNHTKDESIEDIKTIAYTTVWEATDKYVSGIVKKVDGKFIRINYKSKFLFCQFASSQVNFKLRTFLRLQNQDRICGHAPDSDDIKKIYSQLPKIKFKNGNFCEKDFSNLAAKTEKLTKKDVKYFNRLITAKTISGDQENYDEENNKSNNWDYLIRPKKNNVSHNLQELSENNLENELELKLIESEFHNLKNEFLKKLSFRDRDIFINTILKEFYPNQKKITLLKLGEKYNISAEAARKISRKRLLEFEIIIKKNKKKLGR